MLVSDFAYRDMEMRSNGLVERLGAFARRLLGRPMPATSPGDVLPEPDIIPAPTTLHLVSSQVESSQAEDDPQPVQLPEFRWRRHPLLRSTDRAASSASIPEASRSARAAATRGLFLARSGRFAEARDAFAIAAREPEVDLTSIPGFWDLPRGGMLAAAGAYEDNERYRDASALSARLRLMHRPRSIAAVPASPGRKRTAAGT